MLIAALMIAWMPMSQPCPSWTAEAPVLTSSLESRKPLRSVHLDGHRTLRLRADVVMLLCKAPERRVPSELRATLFSTDTGNAMRVYAMLVSDVEELSPTPSNQAGLTHTVRRRKRLEELFPSSISPTRRLGRYAWGPPGPLSWFGREDTWSERPQYNVSPSSPGNPVMPSLGASRAAGEGGFTADF